MKKLLSILASVGLTATTAASVVACAPSDKKETEPETSKLTVPTEAETISLTETHKGDSELKDADKKIVKDAIIKKLKDLNTDVVIEDDTLTVKLDKVAPSAEEVKVDVKATEGKDDKKGLEAETITFKVKFEAANLGQKDANHLKEVVKVYLTETEKGASLTETDVKLVQSEIVSKLLEANKDANVNKETTFTAKVEGATSETTKISVHVAKTESTQDKYGLNEATFDVNVNLLDKDDAKKEKILEEIQTISADPKSFVFQGFPTGEGIESKDVLGKLQEYLAEYKDSLSFKEVGFSEIEIDNSGIHAGNLTLNIAIDEVNLTNPETENEEFKFNFINEEYKEYSRVDGVIDELTKENGSSANLSDFKLDLGGQEMSIGQIFGMLGPILKANDIIPDKVPTKFDNSDKYWKQWQDSLSILKGLLSAYIDIDSELQFVIPIPDGTMKDLRVVINTKVSDILNSILPDLIHLRQFMLEQKDKTGNDNLLLLLIQYLFTKPEAINDDGFDTVNQNIENENKPKEIISFNTNLEHLLHNLLEGWQNSENEIWQNDNTEKEQDKPLNVYVYMTETSNFRIAYQGPKGVGAIMKGKYSILDLLPLENIKSFVTQLFSYDLVNLDEKPETLQLTLEVPVKGAMTIDIPLTSLLKNGLGNILNTNTTLNGQLDDLSFEWKKGTMKIQLFNQDKEWVDAKEFDDIMTATDIQVKFVENTWVIHYSDLSFELENIDFTLALDLKASTIV